MENKTDKPYSLQDAKNEFAIQQGFKAWDDDFMTHCNYGHLFDAVDNVSEYFKSKATEELRKENEELQTQVSMFQTDRSERIEEMKRLKESNKELVEALKVEIEKTNNTLKGDFGQIDEKDIFQTTSFTRGKQIGLNVALSIIKEKSEGDVNKKV